MKNWLLIVFFLLSALLAACSSIDRDPASYYQGQSAQQIFTDGENAMLKSSYDLAIKHFEALDARYPFSKYTRQSHLDMIYTYYMQNDTASALAAADRYIRLYPRGPHVDYAYYMRGLIGFQENRGFIEKHFVDFSERNLNSLRSAFQDFNQIVRYFPHSPYAQDARKHMLYIRNLFARHELQVAQFYLARKAYVGAVNRANEVVLHYQGTPSVPDALAVMVKGYRGLGYGKDADKVFRLLRLNYPHSKAFRSVS